MAGPIAIVEHPACDAHDPGDGHPESRARLPAIRAAIRADPALGPGVAAWIRADPAALDDVLRVHTAAHLARVREAAERAARDGTVQWLDPDTAVSAASFEAALAAAGCAVRAAELVARGEASAAFALARPPGHHAARDRAMGFCLLSNVAIAARALLARCGVDRVLVVDLDHHHGNGTQAVFWEEPAVRFLSVHADDDYPHTGAAEERGAGAGLGAIRNVPVPRGAGAAELRRRASAALAEVLDGFAPGVVLVSAGFDMLDGDPLGGAGLAPADLHAIVAEVRERTRASAGGRIAAVLEGGYEPELAGRGAADVVRALAGLPPAAGPGPRPGGDQRASAEDA